MKSNSRMNTGVHAALLFASALASWSGHAATTQTQVQPLSGMGEAGEQPVLWNFRLDSGRGSGQWTKIVVPSCWEQQGFGAYYYGTQARDKADDDPLIPHERGTYQRKFDVPRDWNGMQIRIVFEGVMTDTTVRVNGQVAGPTHQGGFYRFEYDITELVHVGSANEIEVDVSKESANHSVNRAERRGDYWTFGGIYRPVWLEARPQQHIEWTAIDARANGDFYSNVHVSGVSSGLVTAQIMDAQGKNVGEPMQAHVDVTGQRAIIQGHIDRPLTWSAETPNLYRVRFELLRPQEGGQTSVALHEREERFGFRTFMVRPADGVYLNGRKIVLKGINRHSFNSDTGRTITREQSYADARLIKDANMNAVRMSHYPPNPHFLEAADELGLYVLDELAGWQGSYDTPSATRLIGQMIRRDVNHPSILFWDNGNEGGWNREVDGEFDRWDPQQRPVLHPWAIFSGINTDHYENYDSTMRLSAGPDIFMPTEFLHGLYDGGIGAGLRDYWDVMSASPTVAGGFFWAFADEGIRRTDQQGRIDNVGNSAPDGIVGPHGEKEGSYFA
ncbi:MAG: glycoside hydrolase family 2 protein, partial [Povalibacter sp.]